MNRRTPWTHASHWIYTALVATLLSACSGGATTPPDGGTPPADGNNSTDPGFDQAECRRDCAAMAMMSGEQYCGTDRQTYAACSWICRDTPQGVRVYPGACQADGSPQPDRPPEPADGVTICDWTRSAGEWVPLECANNLDDMVSELGSEASMTTDFDQDIMSLPERVDHRGRFGAARSQGRASSCTAFATVAALESAVATNGVRQDLSEMHLWARYHRPRTAAAVEAARRGGIATRELADSNGFAYDSARATAWQTGRETVPENELRALDGMGVFELGSLDVIRPEGNRRSPSTAQLARALASGHDVVASVFTVGRIWGRDLGSDGVLQDYDLSNQNGHAILLVGYLPINGRRYFIFRNSWGAGFGAMGYGYISEATLEANMMAAPFFTLSVRNVQGGRTAPNCPDSQAAGSDGQCRTICMDGSLANAEGTCGAPSVQCEQGLVADNSGTCVSSCRAGMSMVDGRTVNCNDRGCTWTIPDGQDGCTNGPCDRQCPAPNCELIIGRNEMNEILWTCGSNSD